jgi:glutathione peroxidase-family protein
VKFSLLEKVDVNGSETHVVYRYLRKQPLLVNPETGKSKLILSDFTICLLNKEGKLFRCFKGSKDFEELKKSLKRTLTHERVAAKKLIISKDIK